SIEELIKIFQSKTKKYIHFVLAYFNNTYDTSKFTSTIHIIYNEYIYINAYINEDDEPSIEDLYFYERAIELRKSNNISYNDLSLNRAKILFDLREYEKSLEEIKKITRHI
ncbi:hypothetical protein, partial [Brachyspira hampsonii]|uniref:hypothetical protein n=1 Tax=Brachyspira hampsonii TaxID=1287055 RepID=UPI0002ADE649